MPTSNNYLPTNLVLFGITGDLSRKKILPALYSLFSKGMLPALFNIVGFARRDLTDTALQEYVKKVLEESDTNIDTDTLKKFLTKFHYLQGDFNKEDAFKDLSIFLGKVDDEWKVCSNKLFYLSVSPGFYKTIFEKLSDSGLTLPCSEEEGWTRIIVEKPFGKDLKTALELDELLAKLFKEEQLFRIDHYLGKEMMDNILLFRFANQLLEKSWNAEVVEKIKISVNETEGVENRINFYDGVGALRDVGQNHLLQMLAYVTMEEPFELKSKYIRKNREMILSQLPKLNFDQVAKQSSRGQYAGFCELAGVSDNSTTETYFKVTLELLNTHWKGVEVVLESGKKLETNEKLIQIFFKPKNGYQNIVTFNLSGEYSGIYVDLWVKKPGLTHELERKTLHFSLCEDQDACDSAFAYEKLILDCIKGDQTQFVSSEEVKSMWAFIDPIIEAWNSGIPKLESYKVGSTGTIA